MEDGGNGVGVGVAHLHLDVPGGLSLEEQAAVMEDQSCYYEKLSDNKH